MTGVADHLALAVGVTICMPDVVEEEEPVAAPKTKNGAVRSYLTSTITPVLLKALMEMEKEPRESVLSSGLHSTWRSTAA